MSDVKIDGKELRVIEKLFITINCESPNRIEFPVSVPLLIVSEEE